MKIKVTENTKRAFYMSESGALEIMKKEAEVTKDDLEILVNFFGGGELLKSEAEFAKNANVLDRYGEGTGRADVWIDVVIEGFKVFYKVGAYLSDIWEIGGTDPEELKRRMYIRKFSED